MNKFICYRLKLKHQYSNFTRGTQSLKRRYIFSSNLKHRFGYLDYFKQQHPTFSKIYQSPVNFSKLSPKIFSNSRTICHLLILTYEISPLKYLVNLLWNHFKNLNFKLFEKLNEKKIGKTQKKYLKSEKYKKLPMMVEKQETKILKRYHIKIFFLNWNLSNFS
jgi:hypothetical protein